MIRLTASFATIHQWRNKPQGVASDWTTWTLSTDDLKRGGLEHLRHHLVARQQAALAGGGPAQDRTLSFSLVMLEHARDHAALYKALVNDRGGSVALGFIRAILGDLIRTDLADLRIEPTHSPAGREATVQYLVGAFMSLMIWWLDSGATMAPGEVDAMFRRLSLWGIALPDGLAT